MLRLRNWEACQGVKGVDSVAVTHTLDLIPSFKNFLPLFFPLTYATKMAGISLRRPTGDWAAYQVVSTGIFTYILQAVFTSSTIA